MWSPETQQWHPGSQRAKGGRASIFSGEGPSPVPGLSVSHPEHLGPRCSALSSVLHSTSQLPRESLLPRSQATGSQLTLQSRPVQGPHRLCPRPGWGEGGKLPYISSSLFLLSCQDAPYSSPGPHLSLPSPSGPGEENRGRPKLPPDPPRPGGDGHPGEDVNTGSVPRWKWNHSEQGGPDPTNSGLRFGSLPPDPEWSEGPREGIFLTTGSEWRAS